MYTHDRNLQASLTKLLKYPLLGTVNEKSSKKLINKSEYTGAIVLPPPNITGELHLGHALNILIQDYKVRHYKLLGELINWIPGVDHSGIYAQIVLNKRLHSMGIICTDPQELLEHMLEWKKICEQNILNQISKMEVSINTEAYTFTMDEKVKRGVIEAFNQLYEKGLLFRAKRIVHWDIDLQTVLSDIEVTAKEQEGNLWFIKYELENSGHIEVATTRPETIFADEAVAVHPDDVRYKNLHGVKVRVPLTDKFIPIVAHRDCQIDKGSGAVKIDPAHGEMDFTIGAAYDLPINAIIDKGGRMFGDVPDWILGLDRFVAKKKIVDALESGGYILRVEPIIHSIPIGEKSQSMIEPLAMDQWFLDMPQLKSALRNWIESDAILISPDFCKKLYMRYIDDLRPWCISRQLWWGHAIPAWHTKEGEVIVARSEEEARNRGGIRRDNDVLDTWFSSAMWPFVTLGWPDPIDPQFYPNKFLVTGRDILFFWVMKMSVMSAALELPPPFKRVYLHGIIKSEDGTKMSKSKGNVVNFVELIDKEGIDTLRMALLSLNTAGSDARFGQKEVDSARKFILKIRNAFRFIKGKISSEITPISHSANHWIIRCVAQFQVIFDAGIEEDNWFKTTSDMYNLFWNKFCSVYIEAFKFLAKTEYAKEAAYTLYLVGKKMLQLLFPIVPSLAQNLWSDLFEGEDLFEGYKGLLTAKSSDFENFILFAGLVRSIFAKFKISRDFYLLTNTDTKDGLLTHLTGYQFAFHEEIDNPTCSILGHKIHIPKEAYVYDDLKLSAKKEIDRLQHDINHCEKLLADRGFLDHAGEEKINQTQSNLKAFKDDLAVYLTFN